MRRHAVALAALAATLAAPAGARAAQETVRMPGKFFAPARVTVVAGDVVTFRNDDLATHDVRIAGGAFDSGPLPRLAAWTPPVAQPGEYPFVCTLHAFMSGHLSVVAATLAAPPGTLLAGQPLRLSGRAPAGTRRVDLERSAASGGPWSAVGAPVTPATDGTFQVTTRADAGASYRAVTAGGASPPVTPRVSAGVDLHVGLRRGKRGATLAVHAMGAPEGMVATLELYARWRYRWRAHRSVALDAHGAARFRIAAGLRTYARVALRPRPGAPALTRSRVLRTSDGRAAPDPDALAPPAHSGDPHGRH